MLVFSFFPYFHYVSFFSFVFTVCFSFKRIASTLHFALSVGAWPEMNVLQSPQVFILFQMKCHLLGEIMQDVMFLTIDNREVFLGAVGPII